jgi:hypothetical protein
MNLILRHKPPFNVVFFATSAGRDFLEAIRPAAGHCQQWLLSAAIPVWVWAAMGSAGVSETPE